MEKVKNIRLILDNSDNQIIAKKLTNNISANNRN